MLKYMLIYTPLKVLCLHIYTLANLHGVEVVDKLKLAQTYPCLWRAHLADTGFADVLGPVSVESSPLGPLVLVSRSLPNAFLM